MGKKTLFVGKENATGRLWNCRGIIAGGDSGSLIDMAWSASDEYRKDSAKKKKKSRMQSGKARSSGGKTVRMRPNCRLYTRKAHSSYRKSNLT